MLGRPGLPTFEYIKASNHEEVIDLLADHGGEMRLMLGGTNLFPQIRAGTVRPKLIVDIKHLPGIQDIQYDERSGLTVGAAVTMNALWRHPEVRAHYPLLCEAANSVASYQIRNRATVGGNLCNASPCADMAPASLVHEARMIVHGPSGDREIAASDFFRGPGETTLRTEEFLVAIRYPVPPANGIGKYLKLGRSRMMDLSIVGVAVFGFLSEASPSGWGFRIALGSVASIPFRAVMAEAKLTEQPPGEAAFTQAAEEAVSMARPIDDVRASAIYRIAMIRALTLRGLHEVWRKLQAD